MEEVRVFPAAPMLLAMNKGLEKLGGCECQQRGTHKHPSITLTVYSLKEEEEPIILQVRDCMTVLQLKYLIEKVSGETYGCKSVFNLWLIFVSIE